MKFSITIPAYKGMFLKDAIESCLSQTYQDFELIIVNDHSPEDLASIIALFDDMRIRYYENEKNYGAINVVDNWNECLSHVHGDYVICMGDDDRLLPWCLVEYDKLIQKYPGLDVFHARTELINEEGNFVGLQESRPEWESALSVLWHQCHCKRIQYIGDYMFRVEALKKEGGFYKLPLALFSDNISTIRAAKEKGIANTQNICFQYRINKYSITNNGNPKILANSIKSAYDWFLEFLTCVPMDDTDKKFRFLLLNGILKKHFYDMLLFVIDLDLKKEGISAISYWEKQCQALNIEERLIRNKLKYYRRTRLNNRLKSILKKFF